MPPPIRVMVVDDTRRVRNMLTSMLALDGFEVAGSSGSGQEAIAMIETVDPDVVVIDYKMPGMDGLETARRVRESRPAQIMIMYSAFIDPQLQDAAEAAGIAVCLAKLEGLASLEHEISRLCTMLL
ncbi:MAG: response regulator [Actinobacteria bacterium]|nr:MAG: response regulator [Actinomycetota bacterium]